MARVLARLYLAGLCAVVITGILVTVPRLFYITVSIHPRDTGPRAYVVDTPGCHIPSIDPFDASVKQHLFQWPMFDCTVSKKPSITYQDGLWLRINRTLLENYHKGGLYVCELSAVLRKQGTDHRFSLVQLRRFKKDVKVFHDFVFAKCFNILGEEISSNFHAFIQPKLSRIRQLQSNRDKFTKTHGVEKPLNVILLGTDSMSRLNAIRQLPKTRHYLKSVLGAIELLGYNKVGDNTFVNMIPMLTGRFMAEYGLNSTIMKSVHIDHLEYIWKKYADGGYTTMLAEDDPTRACFTYLKRGFLHPPTDYYYRPMSLAMESVKHMWSEGRSCFGDRFEIQVIFSWLLDFLRVCRKEPSFSFTFLTRLSHDFLSKIKVADGLYVQFLKRLKLEGHLNNSVLFFFSDHGLRFGAIRETYTGKMEDRLPMMYISLPDWFHDKYPVQVKHLKANAARLTTHFDIHETLKHILFMNFTDQVSTEFSSRRGVSLFLPITSSRTCSEAGIPPEWCTCNSQIQLPLTHPIVQQVSMATISHMNRILNKTRLCVQLSLRSIQQAWTSALRTTKSATKSNVDYQVTLTTSPGDGMFEATVRHFESDDVFEVVGDISRINRYGHQSFCVDDAQMEMFCYCLQNL